MNIKNRITELLNVKYPIIQGGMVWVSGWKLASAVSNNGGFGLIGSGSMKPELLMEHIRKCKSATTKPFGVNIPLLREDAEELIDVTIKEGIKIVFTSAGNPAKFIDKLKSHNLTVVHIVASVKHGLKAQSIGCDAVVGEGVEAGGHNGADELTTLTLIPQLVDNLNIPVIAAGGIADGRAIAAVFALGAEGVQIGTRFAATIESSAHPVYKQKVLQAKDTDTVLILKKAGLTRVIKNEFSKKALETEFNGADKDELLKLLGKKREKTGIFEGDENGGIFEAGQSVGLIDKILPVKEVFNKLISEFDNSIKTLAKG